MLGTGAYLEPGALTLLKGVFEDAVRTLPTDQQTEQRKLSIATRLMRVAAAGERDPVRLRTIALMASPDMHPGSRSSERKTKTSRVVVPSAQRAEWRLFPTNNLRSLTGADPVEAALGQRAGVRAIEAS